MASMVATHHQSLSMASLRLHHGEAPLGEALGLLLLLLSRQLDPHPSSETVGSSGSHLNVD